MQRRWWRVWVSSGLPHRVPQCQLPLAHAAEPRGEHFAVGQEDGTHGPGALVSLLQLLESGGQGVSVCDTRPSSPAWALRLRGP